MTNPPPSGTAAPAPGLFSTNLTDQEIMLSLTIVGFHAVALAIVAILIIRRPDLEIADLTRLIGLILIIGGALLLVSSGFDKDQITGVVGLMGAIAGYLLGCGFTSGRGRHANAADTGTQDRKGAP